MWAWYIDDPHTRDQRPRDLSLLRLAIIPIGAYLLLTPAVHPWYVTMIVPWLAFLIPDQGESTIFERFMWPWLYLSIAVALSYFTYIDTQNLREFTWVRNVEYLPFYGLLTWATLMGLWQTISQMRSQSFV